MTGSPTMPALRKHAAGEHALHLDQVATPQARPGWVVLDVVGEPVTSLPAPGP